MNSYLRMASLAAALLWAAAVLVIAQPVQAATVTTNFYSNRLNDCLPGGSPTFRIIGSFSFAFDGTLNGPKRRPVPGFFELHDGHRRLVGWGGCVALGLRRSSPTIMYSTGIFRRPSRGPPQPPIQMPGLDSG